MVKGRGRRTGGAALIEKFEGSRRAKGRCPTGIVVDALKYVLG
jgi:hypothetical protein